ncbi:uncharacterized protein BCN122_II2794 [Burkholderia cenocepacia]|nr:uncharacterized protein BCN122_II2793 [Burkholderia cenocepacia]ARF89537.1 uncharacterized protein BCN122_II2794 [Burkholderia cenocepacia]
MIELFADDRPVEVEVESDVIERICGRQARSRSKSTAK